MSLLSAILPSDIEGVKWAKLQRIFRQIADNAGISYALGFPLTDIQPSDTEGIKWQKLGAWAKLIADNIGGGGGGGVTSIAGTANQIVASAATGPVVLSLASQIANMGEIITKAQSAGTVMVSTVPATVCFIDLPAGVWEIDGQTENDGVGGNPLITEIDCTISLVDNTQDFTGMYDAITFLAPVGLNQITCFASSVFTLSVPTRVYLVMEATFTANGVTSYGTLRARRAPSVTVQP